jgi:imidazole glycerol-phosphate synthase subunit HisH
MIAIIDYGMGNTGSLENMIRKVGGECKITSDPKIIHDAEKLVLPGVGSFDNGIELLNNLNLVSILNYKVKEEKVPVLCICLGAQLISNSSEEGKLNGLGWIDAEVIKFRFIDGDLKKLRIPHMGWNDVTVIKESLLFENMPVDPSFYFVHSFHLVCNNPGDILTRSVYGYEFVSAIEKENLFATQFHPEKSHKYGMQLIRNFVERIC